MPRFFAAPELIGDSIITLAGEDAKHISRSLRMRTGETITVCDGNNTDYICTILNVDTELVQAQIIEKHNSLGEPGTNITLFASLSKGERMDFTIQKSVELGVSRIVPFLSARCIAKPDKNARSRKNDRFSKISEEAAKQCSRGIIPKISEIVTFNEMLILSKEAELSVLFYEEEHNLPFKRVLSENEFKSVAIITGPEGGFEPFEVSEARNAGILVASLGTRILRCETAPLCALASILYHTGEI